MKEAMMKQITWEDQWIGYDDLETTAMKRKWASGYCFGGTMIWSVDFETGSGRFGFCLTPYLLDRWLSHSATTAIQKTMRQSLRMADVDRRMEAPSAVIGKKVA